MFLAGSPSFSLLAASSLAFLFWSQAQRGAPEKKFGLSEVSPQCTSEVTACQLAKLGRTAWSAQNLRAAFEARTRLAASGHGRGRNVTSKMLTELIPGWPAVPSPGSLSACLKEA